MEGGYRPLRPIETIRFASTDPEQAGELFTRPFPGIELSAPGRGADFSLDYEQVSDGRMTVRRLRLTGTGVGHGAVGDDLAVARVRTGTFELQYGSRSVDTTGPYLRPPGQSRARMHNAALELITLEPDLFAAAAQAHLESTGWTAHAPTADATSPRAPELVKSWHRTADLVMTTAFDGDAFASPLIRAGLFDLVVSGLLAAFPITAETGSARKHRAEPATLRRALTFIDEHLTEPIDVTDIAAAARLPIRTLHAAFRAHTGISPMEHVRLRRLAAAHTELLHTDPTSGATVAAIAHRWGFAHLARFAGLYRRIYGEPPSSTLRR